jgi:hypothetical protein
MRIALFILLACALWGCRKDTITIRDRGEAFARDTSITFGQLRGEPGATARTISFNTSGEFTYRDDFDYQLKTPVVGRISPDTVRMILRHAIDAGIYHFADTIIEEPDEMVLDGPSIYSFAIDEGRRSKSITTDASDRDLNRLITLYCVVEFLVWERLPEAKRWHWYGPPYRFEDIKRAR